VYLAVCSQNNEMYKGNLNNQLRENNNKI
jgi:hypothetical protein